MIGRIYEAAADPSRWSHFLTGLADAMGAAAATLWVHDFGSSGVQTQEGGEQFHFARFDPKFLEDYAAHYTHTNVWAKNEEELSEGTAVVSSQLYPDEDLMRTEFYGDWLRPQNFFYAIGGVVAKRGDLAVKLSALRSQGQGAYTEEHMAFYQLLLPHLKRACEVQRRLAYQSLGKRGALEALNSLPGGVLVLDATGRICYVNRAAEALLVSQQGLRLDLGGQVRVVQPGQDDRFHRLLRLAGTGIRNLQNGGRLTIDRPNGRPLTLLIVPFVGEAVVWGKTESGVLVFIQDPDCKPALFADAVRENFGLTPAQARLAVALASGKSLSDSAEHLGVTITTARSHLSEIFVRTGAKRQADLVRMLLSTPLNGNFGGRDDIAGL